MLFAQSEPIRSRLRDNECAGPVPSCAAEIVEDRERARVSLPGGYIEMPQTRVAVIKSARSRIEIASIGNVVATRDYRTVWIKDANLQNCRR